MFWSWVYRNNKLTSEAHLLRNAVSSCHNPLLIDEGPPTNMKTVRLQVKADLPGPESSCGIDTTDNL